MKVILEFDGTEEQEDIYNAINGHKFKCILWELKYNRLRSIIKYSNSEEEIKHAEYWRDILNELLEEYGVDLE